MAALEAFAHSTDFTKKTVTGSLLHVIQQQEYLKSDPERFADKMATKLQRAIPAMFANNRPINENDLTTKSRVSFKQTRRNTDENFPQHNLRLRE